MTGARRQVVAAPGTTAAALANGHKLLTANPGAAALQARTILRSEADNAAALRLLSQALAALGEAAQAQAAMARAIELAPRDPIVSAIMAQLRAGDGAGAVKASRTLHARSPDDPVAALLLGEARLLSGDHAGAVAAFSRTVELAPGYPAGRMGLARAHHIRFDIAAALAALDPVLRAPAGVAGEAVRYQATLLAEAADYAGAEEVLAFLAARHGEAADLHLSHGDALRTLGRPAQAEQAYRRAIARAPAMGRAWWGVVNVHDGAVSDADRRAIEDVARRAPDPAEATFAAFAAAAAARGSADPALEMTWLQQGNTDRRRQWAYDAAAFGSRMRRVGRTATAKFFAQRDGWGDQDPAPIFVVGMPRSGSTLLEQMLGRHSAVEGCGELPLIPALLREAGVLTNTNPEGDLAALLKRLSRRDCSDLGGEYIRRSAARRRTGKRQFIDKLPHNWAEMAFIRSILPNATIIDIRRHPLDCIVSNYRMIFAPGHPASYDMVEMAGYYATYVEAADAFRAAAPGYKRVVYERLVDNPRNELTRILGSAGLDFEAGCLDFHSEGMPVATASAEQVRRAINREGIGIWRRFDPWLDPVRDRLGDVIETWDA